jgi:hypothetical protein
MLLYHGTVSAYLPAITANGLKPSKANAWKITLDDGSALRDIEEVNAVFLTPSKARAIQYAQTKAKYLSIRPGDEFVMYGEGAEFWKQKGTPQIQTEPVLLTLGDISPEHIKAVTKLKMLY